jgi:uncharacterized membrane protein YuzA (DUF378 family)
MTLFFAKPLGTKNMMQRMLVIATGIAALDILLKFKDFNRTEKEIKECCKEIGHQSICDKIRVW